MNELLTLLRFELGHDEFRSLESALLEPPQQHQKLALESMFDRLLHSVDSVRTRAVVTLLKANTTGRASIHELEDPALFTACTKLAAQYPHAFNERGRILQHDLLYNFYCSFLLQKEEQCGLEEALSQLPTQKLSATSMGYAVLQNALLALVRERLTERHDDLRTLRDRYQGMKALADKVDELLAMSDQATKLNEGSNP